MTAYSVGRDWAPQWSETEPEEHILQDTSYRPRGVQSRVVLIARLCTRFLSRRCTGAQEVRKDWLECAVRLQRVWFPGKTTSNEWSPVNTLAGHALLLSHTLANHWQVLYNIWLTSSRPIKSRYKSGQSDRCTRASNQIAVRGRPIRSRYEIARHLSYLDMLSFNEGLNECVGNVFPKLKSATIKAEFWLVTRRMNQHWTDYTYRKPQLS